MASKVLVPTAPFAKIQPVKKSPVETNNHGPGFIISSTDPVSRAAHLEASIRFLQEQHRATLTALHREIDVLAHTNRDLQFQLIFNKETPKSTPTAEPAAADQNTEELKKEIAKLEREASTARGEARAAEARALQLQKLVDAQAEKIRALELTSSTEAAGESRAELRARLSDAERLARRLRADGERQRRELQCMKNSLQQSLRNGAMEPGFGFHNSYHFPPAEFWREPLQEEYNVMSRGRGGGGRRPLTLPELSATGHQLRSTVYANNHTRPRVNGYEEKNRKAQYVNNENINIKPPEEQSVSGQSGEAGRRARRRQHRKHNSDHT